METFSGLFVTTLAHEEMPPPHPLTSSHASTFNLYSKYHIFKFTYLNFFSMYKYNIKFMGLLSDIKFFYLDEMFHQLTSHHTDVLFLLYLHPCFLFHFPLFQWIFMKFWNLLDQTQIPNFPIMDQIQKCV